MVSFIIMIIFIILLTLFVLIHSLTDETQKEYINDIYLEINKRGLK